MDIPSRHAVDTLNRIGTYWRTLGDLQLSLLRHPQVREAWTGAGVWKPIDQSPILEIYIDVRLKNETDVHWGIDATWDEHTWRVESVVRVDDPDHRIASIDLPVRSSDTLAGFFNDLDEIVSAFLDSVRQTNLDIVSVDSLPVVGSSLQ